jgi:DNA-binding MarR family transcriptional regulator
MTPVDLSAIDTNIHGPVRLGVISALAMEGRLDFTSIRKRLGVTDGSLGMHLQKLEDVGYITSTKIFLGRRPNTSYAITATGRKAFAEYLALMKRLIADFEAAK